MDQVDLKAIAKSRVDDPLNTWPDHISCHRLTLMGNFLWDGLCLRCHLERIATEQLKVGKESRSSLVEWVEKARQSASGCCSRYADNMACDCMEEARKRDRRNLGT